MKLMITVLLFALLSTGMTAPAMDNAEVQTYVIAS